MKPVQEMKECDWPNPKKCCQICLKMLPGDVALCSGEVHFHFPDALISKFSSTGLKAIHAEKDERPLHKAQVTV